MSSEQFGQRRPPLSVTIKSILERYPDGQIFKEMIQNADDAGAKTVWFYVDERQHCTSNLPHPELGRFQGPALVAANDACFTKQDWDGIQSLQQSVKADDPFKVGRFGIGFNSVYHLTDLPIIVSGNRLACFEPQERMWRNESGQAFELSNLVSQSSDFVAPLEGLAGFHASNVRYSGYPHTIFRLPLRTAASGLSENVYSIQRLQELLDALRAEAKYLLLFLKSVCKIEVVHISQYGQHSTSFCVQIAPADLEAIKTKRNTFMQQLKSAHNSQPYAISNVISFTATFSVVVTDNNAHGNQGGTSKWLIANCVGSGDQSVLTAAAKQHTFPWVGTVLELGSQAVGGRIFCFLPMPVEAASGLPVHVNGTFGLNDERRTLKWPGIERRNDPTANWNKTLVSQLLPSCYVMLLTVAKSHLSPEQFYNAWPDINIAKSTQFSEVLKPLFTSLFQQPVVWTKRIEALQEVGNWILTSQATFVSEGSSLPSVMESVLSKCAVQLVTVPPMVWRALKHARVGVTEVSPMLARSQMRLYPGSYSSVDPIGKRVILTYCLSDSCYNDLSGLSLLPLANGTFTSFDTDWMSGNVYLCSADCPCYLLPNLDSLLVDVMEDHNLQQHLSQVALYQNTKLRYLTDSEVAKLLSQAVPSGTFVSMPHPKIPPTWLQIFWNWLQKRDLRHFQGQLLVPCYSSASSSTQAFHLAPLNSTQPVIYVSMYESCSHHLLSALYKMSVRVCLHSEFRYVQHRQISSYLKQLDTNSVLDAISSQANFKGVAFTAEETNSIQAFIISKRYNPSGKRRDVLLNIPIFTSTSNSSEKLFSVNTAATKSIARQTIGEPNNCAFSMANLPSNLIILSRTNHYQLQLLQSLNIPFISDFRLLVNQVFPLVQNGTLSNDLMDKLMPEVLDMFQILNSRENKLAGYLQNLPFVKTVYGRKSPSELFTPFDPDITALYNGEDVFPQAPYNTAGRIQTLQTCGLCISVSPQQILNIIHSISCPLNQHPQQVDSTRFGRAQAVLKYISKPNFHSRVSGYFVVANDRYRSYTFRDGLKHLSTNWSWLPVLSSRPSGYPGELTFKGDSYNSHFISLNHSAVLSHSMASTLSRLIGSQVFFISPNISDHIAAMLTTDSGTISQHVVAHFKEILRVKSRLSADVLHSLVHMVYAYMNSQGAPNLRSLYAINEWIYLKREQKFVMRSIVALQQNPLFKQDLEPYIYILPDTLSRYTILFGSGSGVAKAVSQSQILSILKMIRDDRIHRTTADEAWRITMNILNWLTNNGNQTVSEDIDQEKILVPVETTSSTWPQLVQASKLVYTDNEFLKDYLQSSEERDSHQFVHDHISPRMAQNLGVVPLSEYLDISEDTFEDAGQHEPLTTRLKNILRDYKDGLTIIKELLQNADDAQATEVNICYDARQHEQNQKKLFFSGMAEAHGPALIVHNNAMFSDDDFKNITKLAAATKQNKALKIGKFGIGFCSVYHMTDVPSFISQEFMYIFDPTLSHLKKEVKNPAQPGKKTKFTHKFISGSKQLEPYDGLFGFKRTQSYQGTMFRLPFRTHASELSGTCYTEATVRELLTAIKESSYNLLLFLQNVKTITFQQINPGQEAPIVLLRVSRESIPLSIPLPSGVEVRHLSCDEPQARNTRHCHWLVSHLSETSNRQYYTASVACPLGSPGSYEVDSSFSGEIFCFLPLAQKTGLPVHISSNFAVINNRRGIWTSSEATSQTDAEVQWNLSLMQGVIPRAYHGLLQALKLLASSQLLPNYIFHSLWPLKENLLQQNPWTNMTSQVYQLIASDQLFYSDHLQQWLYLTESRFLTPGILCQSTEISLTLKCVLEVVRHLNQPIVNLPTKFRAYFNLGQVTIDESIFTKLFFQHLCTLESILHTRSEVIQHMLEVYAAEYDDGTDRSYTLDNYFKKHSCIPCTPDGRVLRNCDEVVDPQADIAPLFDDSESHFPIKQLSQRHLCYTALMDLGMISVTIPYEMLVERAQTIQQLYATDRPKAFRRMRLIISSCTKTGEKKSNTIDLTSVPFLPVLGKPASYHLPWKGNGHTLMCGRDLMIEGRTDRYRDSINPDLVGSQVVFVNEQGESTNGCGYINKERLAVLSVRRSPSMKEVITHLGEVQRVFESQPLSQELVMNTDRMCRKVYRFLDDRLVPEDTSDRHKHGANVPIQHIQLSHVWTGKQFVHKGVIASSWSTEGPYLYRMPASISLCKHLIESLQLKESFSLDDVQNALKQMKQDFRDQPVDEKCQNFLLSIVTLLHKLELNAANTQTLMLPDENYILHPSDTLAYNDVDWAPKDPKYTYIHNIVPPSLAKTLGVQPARSMILEKFVSSSSLFQSIEFGQHEELTRRIQNIIRDYPFDITVLKELLQNADDAKATKMYIILDKRTHGKQGILSENWGRLQGPALLVWNDSIFTEKDLEGIQKLGLGSKRSEHESIGQYGIGFNVVYHLTDCPSFITGGDTMCVLDPHCEYVHEANIRYPGRMFKDLSQGFWTSFPDMGSAYLQSGLDNCPSELRGGSLFRFPLRHSRQHMLESKIVRRDKTGNVKDEPITANEMQRLLRQWALSMKEAMLFLNNVTELKFMVIEEKGKVLEITKNFLTVVDDSARTSRQELLKAMSVFDKTKGNKSLIVRYPLTIKDVYHSSGGESSTTEKWLIQQGVGDIENDEQIWSFIETVKPRHGIAAPIQLPSKPKVSHTSILPRLTTKEFDDEFKGKVFCFLPLPVTSKLPVHINGNFILNSTRRELWHSTEEEREDDKTVWNSRIFEAIASSYANLLEHAQSFFVRSAPYKTWLTVNADIKRYYEIFPNAAGLDRKYKTLAEKVYVRLVEHNKDIMAVVEKYPSIAASTPETTSSNALQVVWHPPRSSNPSTQVYFWCSSGTGEKWKELKTILEDIGMKLIAAHSYLQDHLNQAIRKEEAKIQSTTRLTVFQYYSRFCAQASSMRQFPCVLTKTVFKNISIFKLFTNYLLATPLTKSSTETPSAPQASSVGISWAASTPTMKSQEPLKFPADPFGHPLLLTADRQLRSFEQNAKVIKSDFSQLFPRTLECFLHPEMVPVCYSSSYFIMCSPLLDNTYSESVVDKLLSNHLPMSLNTKRVSKLPAQISKDQLIQYWECFAGDSVFSFNMPALLKKWALIPSTNGSLHSYNDTLVPVVPVASPPEGGLLLFYNMYQVLRSIGMPILDISVVSLASLSCPSITDEPAILKALCQLNRERDLSEAIGMNIDTIISYLERINFKADPDSLKNAKTLPLFECVDGKYRALAEKIAYVWPSDASTVGYTEWTNNTLDAVFLLRTGHWRKLGSAEDLGIRILSAEEAYCEFIFNYFYELKEMDRYKHLDHIRISLFQRNDMYRKSKSKYHKENKWRAVRFLSDLEQLRCIGPASDLKRVRDFCNQKIEIFVTFERYFSFLPDYFSCAINWDDWLEFFKELGLQQTVTSTDFLKFCKETANGSHTDPEKASTVLLEYLVSDSAKEAKWHTEDYFLRQVGDIAFVPTQSLPHLTWIKSSQTGSNTVIINGRHYPLAKLSEAAVPDCAVLVWTHKPIIKLPATWMPDILPDHLSLANKLGITCDPQVNHVIENIRNICAQTRLTDFQNFDQFPGACETPKLAFSLLDVMKSNFAHLERNQEDVSEAHIRLLRDMRCIPVCATFEGTRQSQIVLVEPCSVLNRVAINTHRYHPFLHRLDSKLATLTFILQQLGVESSIKFSHIQHVLQKAYEISSGQTLQPKTKQCVFAVIKRLIDILYVPKEFSNAVAIKDHFEKIGDTLSPLYLPNSDAKLVLSTELLYVDNDNFKGNFRSQLTDTNYSLLKIRTPEKEISVFEKDFCEMLPEKVRPIGLSTLCSQTVLPQCKPVKHSNVGKALRETFDMKNILPQAVSACVNYYTKSRQPLKNVEDIAREFLTCMEIQTVGHLRTAITLKETNQPLGNLDTKFYLEVAGESPAGCIYLDSQLNDRHLFQKVIAILSKRLLRLIRTRVDRPELITGDVHNSLEWIFKDLFCAQSPDEVKAILQEEQISLDEEGMDEATFVLGKEVSECWHHRLDQTVENIFHPEEIVGYELMEGHIVYARIMHPVLPEGFVSFDHIPRINMRYMIMTDEEDEEGTEVGVLQLYKFLKGLKKEREMAEGTDIVPFEGESEMIRLQLDLRSDNLQDIKRHLLCQLDEIWKLPKEDRKRAIRRLCLKWHPDKNLDNLAVAEDIFKFLNSEISKKDESKDVNWDDLDKTAKQQKDSYRRECQSSGPQSRGGDFGNTGWGGQEPIFKEENLRPERQPAEGKRWLKQAEANYRTLCSLFLEATHEPKVCGDVCFMAHQVAEKSLKAGKYFVCGLAESGLKSHNLSTHAYGLQSERPGETHGLAANTTPLEIHYLDTRYPNRWPSYLIPADQYDYQKAETAKNQAEAILRIVREIIEGDETEV